MVTQGTEAAMGTVDRDPGLGKPQWTRETVTLTPGTMHTIFTPFSPGWVMGLGQMPKSQVVVRPAGQSTLLGLAKLYLLRASTQEMHDPGCWETISWRGPLEASHFIHSHPDIDPTLAQELLDGNQRRFKEPNEWSSPPSTPCPV